MSHQKDTSNDPAKINKVSLSGNNEKVNQSMEGSKVQHKLMKVTHYSNRKRNKKADEKATECYPEPSEKAVDDISESKDRKRKKHKTTEYFYLLERKALRMMRRYYKESFEDYSSKYKYKQNLKRLDRPTVDQYFREYVVVEFERNKSTMSFIGSEQLVEALETIILCDRYNKDEKVTVGLNFDEIRNLLNKYNSKNLNHFFKTCSHAFLYAHYFKLSAAKDVTTQGHVDQDKLKKQMESLFDRSVTFLPDSIKATVMTDAY